MRRNLAACFILATLTLRGTAIAQDEPPVPPANAMKLSDLLATVEKREGFRYVSQVEWNDDGYYDVIYFTTDKAQVEMKVDPVTGKNR
jgi:hypothetical protein